MMNSPVVRMLVVQENRDLAHTIKSFFERSKYEVMLADDAVDAIDRIRETPHFDIVLLEPSLHGATGFDVLMAIRRMSVRPPVLSLITGNDESSIIRSLEMGADDCLVGPFGMNLLAAHVRAILRRTAHPPVNPFEHKKQKHTLDNVLYSHSD